jgi:tetratricopeptide (TPR) repeat protein
MNKKYLIFFLVLMTVAPLCYPEIIKLKNGKVINAAITERTDDSITIEIADMSVTYYLDDIDSISGESPLVHTERSAIAQTPKLSETFEKLKPAIVYILEVTPSGENYLGSGFFINRKGIVVANYHAFLSAQDLRVRLWDGSLCPITHIIYRDSGSDICIFKIDTQKAPEEVTLGDSNNARIGEKVYVMDNSLGLSPVFSDGVISGIRDFNGFKWLEFKASVSSDNTGGPLFDAEGRAIGIVNFLAERNANTNFALAINEIRPFISTTPQMDFQAFLAAFNQGEYHYIKGYGYYLQGDYHQAVSCYEKAIAINPGFAPAYGNLGLVLRLLGQYNQAIPYLEKAIQIKSDYADAYFNLGMAYDSLAKLPQAKTYYEKAFANNPNDMITCRKLGDVYYRLGEYLKAMGCYQKNIRANPNDVSVHNNLALTYFQLRQYERAIIHYNKAIEINPRDAAIFFNRALSYEAVGKYSLAINDYKKALKINPQEINPQVAEIYYYLGHSYGALHQRKEAKENYLKARELFEDLGDIRMMFKIDEEIKKLR